MKDQGKMKGQRAKGKMLLIGIMLAALFWIIESAVEVLIFNKGSFVGQILTVDPHEIWSRLVAMGIIILFGVYGQFAVTRRERVDKTLRESEERYRALVNLGGEVGEAIVMCQDTEQEEAIQTFVSEQWLYITGYSRDELLGMPFFDLVRPEDRKLSRERHRRKMRGESLPGLFEISIIRKDGTEVSVELTSAHATYQGERANVAFIRDITERKQAEETLRESEEKYRSLFEQMLNGLAYCEILVDENNQPVDFVYLEVNDAFERLTGLKKGDVLGRKATAIFPGIKESYPELFSTYGKVALSGQEAKLDIYFKPLEIWLTISVYSPRKGYFVAVFENITERKRAEEALQDSEMEISTILDNAPMVMLLVDREMRVQTLNQAAVQFAERPAEEMIGLYGGDALRCLHYLDDPRGCGFGSSCQTCVKRLTVMDTFQTGNSHHRVEASLPFLRGEKQEELTFLLSTALLTFSKGAMVLVCIEDITERKRMEEELRQYSENLEQRVKERTKELRGSQEKLVTAERLATLGQVSGSISHELRNPLGVIDSSAYYLKTKLKDADEKVLQHLDRIQSGVGSATAIIESLLNLTRMKEPQLERLDLVHITRDAITTSKVPSTVNVARDFPGQEVLVNADRQQLRMAFENIVKNALEAMGGKGMLTVTVRMTSGGQAEVSFADTGPGIATENLDRVFQPLFSTKAKGIGFGLSITKMIINKHGGTIKAESESGKGATIVLHLPLYIEASKEE